jgi:hypothetical protein
MSNEPDPAIHHIFTSFEDAQAFYEKRIRDESLSDDALASITPPRQAIGDRWILNKVN